MSWLVVKLGGSFAHAHATRAAWIDAVAAATGPTVLVPGGGPFADAVRREQAAMGFDDRVAHDLALMAMTQFGTVLAASHPRLSAADTTSEIERVREAGRVPVWLPWPMLRDAPGIEPSWDVTSDSLAVHLAIRLGAGHLLLLKQATDGDDLVDAAFAGYAGRFAGKVWVAGPSDFPAALDPERLPGRRLAVRQ